MNHQYVNTRVAKGICRSHALCVSREGAGNTMKKSETAELNFQQQGRTELERNYKDTVFITVFHEKAKLIELYNAIFDTDYDENTAIDIVTIKDVLFRTLKNDVSFVLDKRFVVLVEHQSTINGNLQIGRAHV